MVDGVVLLGHGSRLAAANLPLLEAARLSSLRLGGVPVHPAFLQLAEPTLARAVEMLREAGGRRIAVVPFFLYPGAHVQEDIPAEIARLKGLYPDLTITLTEHLGIHPLMADIVAELVKAAG